MNHRFKLGVALCALAPLSAFADIKINDNLTISGYAVGSYEYISPDPGTDHDSLFDGSKDTPSADALKTIFTMNFKPVTGVVSLFYIPNIPTGVMKNELTVLDAYVTYDAGGGTTITAGKFLSYLGYEAFDPVNMNQITYGAVTVGTLGAIPAYHTGVKLDGGDKDFGYGLAVVDSVYSPYGIDKGDGELKHNAGFEGYLKYTGAPDLTLWAGFAYDTEGNFQPHEVTVFDVWAEYKLNKATTIAGELCSKDGGPASKGWTWLAYLNYAFTDKVSAVFRISGEQLNTSTEKATGGSDFTQYTFGPAYKVSDNLTVRAEYSYYDYDSGASKSLVGLQGVFKF
ncbi:MAG TPA: porin [Opitutaceae bacterium]|nr:porin [Opitutaceae bacterium]